MSQQNKRWLFLKAITILNVIFLLAYSIAGVYYPQIMLPTEMTADGGSFIFALYVAARILPIFFLTLTAIIRKSGPAILLLGFLLALIQLCDVCIGLYIQDWTKVVGPFIFVIIQLGAIFYVTTHNKKDQDILY